MDNYIVFLRTDEIQQIMQELLSDILNECTPKLNINHREQLFSHMKTAAL